MRGLFQRYAERHLSCALGGQSLCWGQAAEPPLGYVDEITLAGGRLRVRGWSTADRVRLHWSGGEAACVPNLLREDVARVHSTGRYTGFELEAPLNGGPFEVSLRIGTQRYTWPLHQITPEVLRRARTRLKARFIRDMLRCLPALLGHALSRNPVHRATVKRRLGLEAVAVSGPLETRLFFRESDEILRFPTDQPITIVMPVYNAFEITQEALARIAQHTDTPWHAIVVEDCSTDPRVRPWLRDWAAAQNAAGPGQVTLVENETNQGFIGAVNRGFARALAREAPVVLLNSDALVPPGWASRLIRPIFEHPDVASVTPMSNDAEILSVPLICQPTPLAPGEGEALDRRAQQFHPEALLSVLPTGVGFCMALNIAWLRKCPRFDTRFGRGYGEEVDWCQRIRALGGRHLGLPGLFVEHRGGESFGSDAKQKLIAANNRTIAARYPRFDHDVQAFMAADPMITARLALAVALLAARAGESPVSIFLAHSLGGGAEQYLQARIADELAQAPGVLVLRVGGARRWQLELITPEGVVSGGTDEFAFIETLLEPLRARNIVYSCGVGDRDPVDLPGSLVGLRRGPQDRLEVLFHDYFPLSPSYCLLDDAGRYRGPPQVGDPNRTHTHRRPDGACVDLAGWRAAWGALIAAADRLVVFSQDSRRLVAQIYPASAPKILLQLHALISQVPRIASPAPGQAPVIGVLGNIGAQKGAAVVQAMAARWNAQLVVVGHIDPTFALPPGTPVHGHYRVADLDQIAARYGITCWLIPSIWPETFSYTTHEALATGLPVWGFHLGAQGEALIKAENGHVIDFDPDADLAKRVVTSILSREQDRPIARAS